MLRFSRAMPNRQPWHRCFPQHTRQATLPWSYGRGCAHMAQSSGGSGCLNKALSWFSLAAFSSFFASCPRRGGSSRRRQSVRERMFRIIMLLAGRRSSSPNMIVHISAAVSDPLILQRKVAPGTVLVRKVFARGRLFPVTVRNCEVTSLLPDKDWYRARTSRRALTGRTDWNGVCWYERINSSNSESILAESECVWVNYRRVAVQ